MPALVLATAVPLAACVAPAPKPVAAPPVVTLPPAAAAAPFSGDWRDAPLAPGTWRYGSEGTRRTATFGAGIALSCDEDRQVRLRLDGRTSLAPVTIRTSSTVRAVTPGLVGQPPTGIALTFAPRDPLLDAMAFSRGRFTIEQSGVRPLVLPAYAEIGRVIEDCRG